MFSAKLLNHFNVKDGFEIRSEYQIAQYVRLESLRTVQQ